MYLIFLSAKLQIFPCSSRLFPYFLYAFYIFKTCTAVRRSTKLRKFFAETSKKVVFLRYFYYAGIGKSTRVEISTDVKTPTYINTNCLLQS